MYMTKVQCDVGVDSMLFDYPRVGKRIFSACRAVETWGSCDVASDEHDGSLSQVVLASARCVMWVIDLLP